jgi:hypothetical protein
MLRKAEAKLAAGSSVPETARERGISEALRYTAGKLATTR